MANRSEEFKGDFATMGTAPSHAVNISGAPSPKTKPVGKKSNAGGAAEAATATHHANILERNGASLHITAPLYKQNASEASATQRNVRLMPSAIGNRDFWQSRKAAQV